MTCLLLFAFAAACQRTADCRISAHIHPGPGCCQNHPILVGHESTPGWCQQGLCGAEVTLGQQDLPRSESSSSQDYEEMADMLQRMKTVAEDDCFQDAVDAENDQEGELGNGGCLQADANLHG